ncbi:MAG: hypothetical protein GWM98_16055, partial [Nitrospinaceae bacterium]|nr:hypothetical protein [Nitrospinaceae bacterium]
DDRIAAAEAKYDVGEYNEAIRIYEEARNALDALGALPDVAERLELIRARIATCKYQRASVLTRYGDYDSAIRLAREASLEGHPKAPKLVDIIQKRIDGPQEVVQAPEPRWRSDDFKDMRRTIRDRLRQGRDFYVAQEFDKALDTFESVLFIDPQNTEAIRWREKTVQVINDRARMELESTRRDMMATVSRTWNPRDYGASEFADTSPAKGESPTPSSGPALQRREILEKMRRIKIPEIDFRETNIHDVIGFLTDASAEYDDDDVPDEHKGINIILNISDSDGMDAAPVEESFLFDSDSADTGMGVPTITFKARGISLLEALDLTTQIGGLKYRVQGSVVMVIPVDDPGGEIVHRTYSVLPTVGEVISNLSQDFGNRGGGGGGDFITLENEGIGGDATDWQEFFRQMGVDWPRGSSIKYIQSIGKLLVANTVENLTTFEEKL